MSNFQVVIDQTVRGQSVKNVTYWQLPNDALLTKQEFTDALRASYVANVHPYLSLQWFMNSLTFRKMEGAGPFTELLTFTLGALSGLATGDLLPLPTALLVSTGFLGPKPNRGRIYFAGITEGHSTSTGQPLAAALAAFETLVEAWRDGITTTAGSAFLRIARPNFTLNTWTLNNPVESVIARPEFATQRRRRVGVGV